MANAVGRPKIKTTDFDEGWQQRIIDDMSMGASRAEIYAMLDISDKTFARLMRDDHEFLRTIKRGERLSQAWWEKMGRTYMRDKEFSATLWYMNMKNRFGWADNLKTDVTSNGEQVGVTDPSIAAGFSEFMKKKH